MKQDEIKQIEELHVDIMPIPKTADVTVTIRNITVVEWQDALDKVIFLNPVPDYYEVANKENDVGGNQYLHSTRLSHKLYRNNNSSQQSRLDLCERNLCEHKCSVACRI